MENYPDNSHSSRKPEPEKEEKKVEKIIKGKAVLRRKPLGKRLFETFVGGDAKSAWTFVRDAVVIPAVKDALSSMVSQSSNAVTQGFDRLLFPDGNNRPRSNSRPQSGNPRYVNYTQYSSSSSNARRREDPRPMSQTGRRIHDFREVELDTRSEANDIIDKMAELAAEYGQVTLTDFYNLVGITPTWQDDKFGWKDISGFGPVRRNARTGWFMFDFPPPEQLE